ncbi:hypothetical protein ACQP1G_10525 [Nocardia sp. CA-107356]|uniref:hypothetical protein n=1 Tax=Nocardia sp. CA-107356 TaxID=3239972 RepID=UPI003D931F95
MSLGEREHFEQAVHRLTEHSVPLPDFGGFHPAFRDTPEIHSYKPISGAACTPKGHGEVDLPAHEQGARR